MAKILIIDDCETTLELVSSRLALDGHEVVPTLSGRQALFILKYTAFDLIISDVYMPDLDGLEILCGLHALGVRTPIIVMSANGLSLDMFPIARSFGAFATVQKPIDFKVLSAAIESALASRPTISDPSATDLVS